jgi:hypothetical protein
MRLVPAPEAPPDDRPVVRLPSVELGVREATARVLDFDIETVAAGFADPNWVPQKITCVAWSWVGSDRVESRICGPLGFFGKPGYRRMMLMPLLEEIAKADMVTGHNLERFDLPVINAECMRLDLEPISNVLVQDTMRVYRAKGFKKGQDNLGRLFRIENEKLSLDWQAWQDAYDEDGWETVRQRAESDVAMHKEMRLEMLRRDLLKPPRPWRGK